MIKKPGTFFLIWTWVLMVQLIGSASGFLTKLSFDRDAWYNTVIKSSLTPPSIVFSIVWPVLYFLIALVGFRLFHRGQTEVAVRRLFITQLVLNFAWTPVFFTLHWLTLATVIIFVMIILVAWIEWRLCKSKSWMTAILFLPYQLWLCFAFYLNVCMVLLN